MIFPRRHHVMFVIVALLPFGGQALAGPETEAKLRQELAAMRQRCSDLQATKAEQQQVIEQLKTQNQKLAEMVKQARSASAKAQKEAQKQRDLAGKLASADNKSKALLLELRKTQKEAQSSEAKLKKAGNENASLKKSVEELTALNLAAVAENTRLETYIQKLKALIESAGLPVPEPPAKPIDAP